MTLRAMKTNKTFNVVKKIIGKRIPSNSKVQTKSEDISSLILHDREIIKNLILVLKDSEVGISKKKSVYAQFEEALSTPAKAEEARKEFDLKERVEIGREYTKFISLLRGGQSEKNIQMAKVPKLVRGRILKK